jgi:hypothetical protein
VPRIIVLNFWKDWSKRSKVIKWKSIVSTDWQQQTHHLYSHTMFVAWLLKNQDHENQYVADWRTKDEYFIPQANQDIYCVYCVTFSISSHILQKTLSWYINPFVIQIWSLKKGGLSKKV